MYPFVVRVYGVYIDPEKGILVTDEYIKGNYITKFPGGGLEFGEGTRTCLQREMTEETGNEFEIGEHFYTTDFFVLSAFDDSAQVISVYYLMKPAHHLDLKITEKQFDFNDHVEGAQIFRFIPLEEIGMDSFTLIIDQKVGGMLRKRFLLNENS